MPNGPPPYLQVRKRESAPEFGCCWMGLRVAHQFRCLTNWMHSAEQAHEFALAESGQLHDQLVALTMLYANVADQL